jgi:hypothetical protein
MRYVDEVYQVGSGFRRAKMTHKNSEEISCFDILRAEGFSCSLDVYHVGPGIKK